MSIWCLTAVLSGRLESELSESRVFTGKEQAKQTERISADLLIIILFNKLLASSQIINRNIVTLWQRLMGSLGKLITLWRAHISRSDWAISAIAFTSQTMTSHKCARNGLSAAKDCLSLSTSHSQWFGFNLFIYRTFHLANILPGNLFTPMFTWMFSWMFSWMFTRMFAFPLERSVKFTGN